MLSGENLDSAIRGRRVRFPSSPLSKRPRAPYWRLGLKNLTPRGRALAVKSAMMGAWKAVGTRESATGRSSVAPKGFVSALPSRSGGPVREALGNRLTRQNGDGGFGVRIDYGRARSSNRVVDLTARVGIGCGDQFKVGRRRVNVPARGTEETSPRRARHDIRNGHRPSLARSDLRSHTAEGGHIWPAPMNSRRSLSRLTI